MIRPRVRRRTSAGTTDEASLSTYEGATNPGHLEASILAALKARVSSREVADVAGDSHGTSRSRVSQLWKEVGQKFVNELRNGDLSQTDWVVLMIDAIVSSKDETGIVVIGIVATGVKNVLDFELGSSENKAVCVDLLRRITTSASSLATSRSAPPISG